MKPPAAKTDAPNSVKYYLCPNQTKVLRTLNACIFLLICCASFLFKNKVLQVDSILMSLNLINVNVIIFMSSLHELPRHLAAA